MLSPFNSATFARNALFDFLNKHKAYSRLINTSETLQGYKGIAKIFKGINHFDSAINYYFKALSVDMYDIECLLGLCSIYINKGLFYSANKVIESLLSFVSDDTIINIIRELQTQIPHIESKPVTFYLPCYNQERFIAQCIESVLAQSYPIIELLVIDDGCTDRSVEISSRYPVKIIRHKVNKGLAYARNTAIRHAKGEFIASIDTDVILDKFWLETLMKHFDDPQVFGVGGRVIESFTVTLSDKWRQVRLSQGFIEDSPVRNNFLYGCNTIFRAKLFKQIGGYDIRFRANYEDVDICKRLVYYGYSTIYDCSAIGRHQRIDSIKKVVDTCYNWRKPPFEVYGYFNSIEDYLKRLTNIKNELIMDTNKLLKQKKFDILYFDFLLYFRSLFKDISNISQAIGKDRSAQIAINVIKMLCSQLKDNSNLQRLFIHLMKDVEDTVEAILGKGWRCEDYESMTQLQSPVELSINDDGSAILNFITNSISLLFDSYSLILQMIQTSAESAHYDEKHNPYAVSKRVMLLNPPWNIKGRRGVRAGSRWPFTGVKISDEHLHYTPYPFFLCYLSSVLKQRGILNVIVDAIAEELTDEEFIERVAGYQPDVIVIETSTASYSIDAWWIVFIKERVPKCKVILTGSHVSAVGVDIIKENHFVDFIIRGEYEIASAELIHRLLNDTVDYSDIKGLIYRDPNGNIVDQGRTETIEIDSLPLPERLKTPIYKYNDLFAGMQFPCLQIHASRGCPYGCIFCVWPQVLYGNRKYRTRDPIKVVDELQEAIDTFGFRSFYFDDDTFNIGKGRIIALCNEIVKKGLKIPWGAMARADCADLETLKAMKEAGLVGIKFGVESANAELLKASGKHLDLQKVRDAVKWCKELGIKTHLTFSFGLPGETHQSIEQTIAFVKEIDPDSAQFSITTPFPATKYYEILKSQGNLLTEMWEYYDGAQYTVVRSEHLTPRDLQNAVERANREFAEFKLSKQCQRF